MLLIAPTGSGKTLAAFLVTLDELARTAAREAPRVHTLYISPLRALSHDIHRTLQEPLAGMQALAAQRGQPRLPIEVAVRTADTPPERRRAMARRPPHLLVTTPESFFLMLLSPSMRPALLQARRVIVDELHALLPTKRGVQLALSLELRDHLAGRRAQRVGLSATLKPPEAGAAWLAGPSAAPARLLDAGGRKPLEVQVVVPSPRFPEGDEGSIWPAVARRVLELIESARSTLVFVNNRRLAERLTHLVNDLAGRRVALTHHGSMAPPARLYVEQALKAGELKAVVATSTLELGIDVGAVDLVVQVQSPRHVGQGIQRIGRSGHGVAGRSRGVLIATHPADLLEVAAAADAIAAGDIEPTAPVAGALDVLVQFVAGAAAIREWDQEELLQLVRRAAPFAELSREMWHDVLAFAAGDIPGGRWRPRIRWDRQSGRVATEPGTLAVLYANAGTIPDRGLYPVYLQGTDVKLGELDEEFTYESRRGDVFWLGMGAWRIEAIRSDRVVVSPAPAGVPARIPFWRGEVPGRTAHLGARVGRLLAEMEERLAEAGSSPGQGLPEEPQQEEAALRRWLVARGRLEPAAADALAQYVARQWRATGTLPTHRRVVVESFPDELGDRRIVLHSPWGRAVHRAWAIALEGYLRRRGLEPDTVAGDDGVMLRLPAEASVDLHDLARLGDEDPAGLVLGWLPGSHAVAQRFREAAVRALLLPRTHRSRRRPLWLQRLRAADLMHLQASRPEGAAGVLLREAVREVAEEGLDLPRLVELVQGVRTGAVACVVQERQSPSPFAAALAWQFTAAFLYEPDAPKAERQATLLMGAPEALLQQAAQSGSLSRLVEAAAFQEVARRRRFPPWLGARPPDSEQALEDWLRLAGDLLDEEVEAALAPAGAPWQAWLERLAGRGSAVRAGRLWVHAMLAPALQALGSGDPAQQVEAVASLLAHRSQSHPGPWRPQDVAARYGVEGPVAQGALQLLEARGLLLRGTLEEGEPPGYLAVSALVEARRRTLELARARAAPVPLAGYARFLLRRHGLLAGAPAAPGPDGVRAALERLAGVRARLVDWTAMLAARLGPGAPDALRRAIDSGEVGWLLMPGEASGAGGHRITLWLRGRLAHGLLAGSGAPGGEAAGPEGAVLEALGRGGSWFGWELARQAGVAPDELAPVLLRLVRSGRIAAESAALLESALQPAARAARPAPAVPAVPAAVGRGPAAYRRLMRTAARRRVLPRAPLPDLGGLRFYAPAGEEADPLERAEAWARVLLARYGVVSRAVAAAEGVPLPWSHMAQALERLEAAGEVLRGYLVEGLEGEQFAPGPDVEALRAEARQGPDPEGAWATAAADPALLAGHAGRVPAWWPPGPPSGLAAGVGGSVLLLLHPGVGSLWHCPDAPPHRLREAAQALVRLASAVFPGRRLVIRTVAGRPVGEVRSRLGWLQEVGFSEGPHTLERWM